MADPQSSNPLNQVLERAMTPVESEPFSDWTPATDVKETSRETVVYVDLPGMDEDEIEINLVGRSLRISGTRDFDHDSEDVEDYVALSRPFGRFDCRIALGGDIAFDAVTAKYKRGILKVRIPKSRKVQENS